MMKIVIASLLCAGLVSSFAVTRNDDGKLTAVEENGAIVLDWHASAGLICYDKANAGNIAKVVCKSKSAEAVTLDAFNDDTPEFTVSGMSCTGDEDDVSKCTWSEDEVSGIDHCAEYVGCGNTDKRQMLLRGVL